MKVSLDRINNALEVGSLFLIAVMVILVWMQVFLRYVFNFSPFWSEVTARFFMIWALLLGAAVVIRKDRHLRVDFLIDVIPPKAARVIEIVLAGITLVFLIVFTAWGLEAAITQYDVRCASIGFCMFWPYLILPISGLFMTVNILVDIWARVIGKEKHNP